MQPTEPIPQDIKTLHDFLFSQFKATDPIEVQNILEKPYYFKYCVNENIETPDPVTRRVIGREYEEKTFEPGESMVLLGGAAYIFIDGVAREYVFNKYGADATANLAPLIEAAKLIIIGKVGYAKHGATDTVRPLQPAVPHNPNVIQDNQGNMPPQQNEENTGAPKQETDAFDDLNDGEPVITEFEHDGNYYDITPQGRHRMNKSFVKQEVYEAARNAHIAAAEPA